MYSRRPLAFFAVALAFLGSCTKRPDPKRKLTIAAAANLTEVFTEVGDSFHKKTAIETVFSYGSTAQLTHQIANGAPFDLLAAADIEHVDALVKQGRITADSRAVYALGQLALWVPEGEKSGIKELKDLSEKQVRFVAIAQPDVAPYGAASIETLKAAKLWGVVQGKLVYANSISQAKQLASSGNAEAAFTAYSLVLHEKGTIVKIDQGLYRPIEQALGVVAGAAQTEEAKQFRAFLLGAEGRSILEKSGYQIPAP